MLEVRSHPKKGRGVFAVSRLACGEIIETAPIILISATAWSHIEPTVLALYIYNFGPTAEEEHAAIALGYASLYNHSCSNIQNFERGRNLFCGKNTTGSKQVMNGGPIAEFDFTDKHSLVQTLIIENCCKMRIAEFIHSASVAG